MEPATEEGLAESGRGLWPPGGSLPPLPPPALRPAFPYLGFLIYSNPHLFPHLPHCIYLLAGESHLEIK